MNVVVLGAGVIGVTTAYYLAKSGHEVVVVDRQAGPGLETSFANAGEVSPGYASPWAGPGVPLKAIKWLLMKHGPLVLRPNFDLRMWLWILRVLRNCTSVRYGINKARLVRLAEYSLSCLQAVRAETGIDYDQRTKGTLQLFRTQKQVAGAAGDIRVLEEFGIAYELLDDIGCIAAEPALLPVREKIVGGLRLPGDETGDCAMFTDKLAGFCRDAGVQFMFGTNVARIIDDSGVVRGVDTSAGTITADAYVVALGSYSPLVLREIGLRIPVYPIKGYSLTIPLTDPNAAPISTVMDESYKVAITRLGKRIRVGGTAEISGYNLTLDSRRRDALVHSVSDLFPRSGDLSRSRFWCGLRPMTPDGPPFLGPTRFANMYLNTGHGTLGWTMACGSGQIIADLVSGKDTDIDVSDLGVDR